jgi:hypothetical protein
MKGRTLQKGKNVAAVLENLEFFKNLEEAEDRVLAEMADETISGRKYFASRNEKTLLLMAYKIELRSGVLRQLIQPHRH